MGKNKNKKRRGQTNSGPEKYATKSLDQIGHRHGNSSLSRDSVQFPLPFPSSLNFEIQDGEFLRNEGPNKKFFRAAMETAFEGFAADLNTNPPGSKKQMATNNDIFPHSTIENALEVMETAGLFRTDVTQPFGLGTKCAKTYVTRCLLGERGTTYRYLGLRMFSHPWDILSTKRNNNPNNTDGNKMDLSQAIDTIRQLNDKLTERTQCHLAELDEDRKARGGHETRGRAKFDVALINRMQNTSELKKLGDGRCSVSWHADSSLEHFSTIAVYHTIKKSNSEEKNTDKWTVALRVAHNSEGPHASRRGMDIESSIVKETPPISVSLPSGSAYYLLDDFNHHHQHAVLAEGDSPGTRFSSTHRLLRESHNVDYMIERCKTVCSGFHKKGSKVWRSEQLLLTEIETEWLRQYFIQGKQHNELLCAAWGKPIQILLRYWSQLESRTKQTIDLIKLAAEGKCGLADTISSDQNPPSRAERKIREKRKKAAAAIEDVMSRSGEGSSADQESSALDLIYDPLALLIEERATMRELWEKREDDYVFRELHEDFRPIPLPVDFNVASESGSVQGRGLSPMPGSAKDLRKIAEDIRKSGKGYISSDSSCLPEVEEIKKLASPTNDEHAKPESWNGWASSKFALEMQHPWSELLLDGKKTIETRAYDLPTPLLGQQIEILESQKGNAGVSSLDNNIVIGDISPDKPKVDMVGWCKFSSVVKYTNRKDFEADENGHLVKRDSGYGWIDGKTKVVYGWVVGESFRYSKASEQRDQPLVRRLRSLFEIKPQSNFVDTKETKLNTNKRKRQNRHTKRKKRY